MKQTNIEKFKKILHEGMIKNFKEGGFLTPIMFLYKGGQSIISEIPAHFLDSQEGKHELARVMQGICKQSDVLVAGIIIEAYGTKIDKNVDSEIAKSLYDGDTKVSDLEDKEDIILMIFSTPVGEEMISYIVDPETKTIGESFDEGAAEQLAGTFSHFFNWNSNS